jgi:hypothetical protein
MSIALASLRIHESATSTYIEMQEALMAAVTIIQYQTQAQKL